MSTLSMSNESIGIQPIHIRFTTNGNKNPEILTRNMIYLLPKKEDEEDDTEKEENIQKGVEETKKDVLYPFFTDFTKFSVTKILKLPREEQIDTFFNKNKFKKLIGSVVVTDIDERNKNAQDNLVIMLNIFFPTVFPIQSNISETFSENMKNVLFETSIQNENRGTFAILGDLFGRENTYGYLNISKPHSVTKITIINDIINDPLFNNIIQPSINFQNWRKETINTYSLNSSNLLKLIKTTINDSLKSIQNTLSDTSSISYIDLLKIRNKNSGLNRDASHPPILLVPYFDTLMKLQTSDVDKIINVFIEIKKLSDQAKDKPNYIPYSIRSLPGFNSLYDNSIKYGIDNGTKNAIEDVSISFNYINKLIKKEKFQNYLEKEVANRINTFSQLTSFKNIIQKYKTPLRYYSNKLLGIVFNESITNISSFLEFVDFLQKVTIEERPEDKYLSNNEMIDKLQTGVMSVYDKESYVTKNKDEKEIDPLYEKINKYYDCFVNFELFDGLLNDDIIDTIQCPYRNDYLVADYEFIKNSEKNNPFIFYNNIPIFDMKKYTQKKRKVSKKTKGGFIPRPNSISSYNKIKTPKKKYTRKERKNRNKYSLRQRQTI